MYFSLCWKDATFRLYLSHISDRYKVHGNKILSDPNFDEKRSGPECMSSMLDAVSHKSGIITCRVIGPIFSAENLWCIPSLLSRRWRSHVEGDENANVWAEGLDSSVIRCSTFFRSGADLYHRHVWPLRKMPQMCLHIHSMLSALSDELGWSTWLILHYFQSSSAIA